MSRPHGDLPRSLGVALLAAATTWVSFFFWHGFTQDEGAFLGPLFTLALLVAVTGAFARWARLPGVLVLSVQTGVSGLALLSILGGSVLPTGGTLATIGTGLQAALDSAAEYAAPVPSHVPGVHPLLIIGGLLCLLLVDFLSCTLHRVPLAGLALLMIYTVPVGVLASVSWSAFTLVAAGFLGMLFLQQDERVTQWGRSLTDGEADPQGFGIRTGSARGTATAIGGLTTALAILVPLLIPTLQLGLFNGVGTGGGDDPITLDNPMTDLRRDLKRGVDIPLLTVETTAPDPSYLRISVLNRFTDNAWSGGDRSLPDDQAARGDLPLPSGVDADLPRTQFPYRIRIGDDFRSRWLPTPAPISSISAEGAWKYDLETRDFLASRDDLTTAGMDYTATAIDLELSPLAMARSPSSGRTVSAQVTEIPDDLPELVGDLADGVTAGAPSRYEKAVALQDWFRTGGGFTYSLGVDDGNGSDALVQFLTSGPGGREGYCEQFASAMAVMARTLGIPARVAVGFLTPDRISDGTYEYSSWDLHAWPELFFAGSGWVRFEPTPPVRAGSVPEYTTQGVPQLDPSAAPSGPRADDLPERNPTEPDPDTAADDAQVDDDAVGSPWFRAGAGLGAVALVGGLLLMPRTVRRRRRARRWQRLDPESAWAELRDCVTDLGLPWPTGLSPRAQRTGLVGLLTRPGEVSSPKRPLVSWERLPFAPKRPPRAPSPPSPPRGRGVDPEAEEALDRVVVAVEESRYAREPAAVDTASIRADVERCVVSLRGGVSRSARRRADWAPASVLRRAPRVKTRSTTTVAGRLSGPVDHVG